MKDSAFSNYLLSITIGHVLLDRKLLKVNEFFAFEIIMCEKYGLSLSSIFRDEYVIHKKFLYK